MTLANTLPMAQVVVDKDGELIPPPALHAVLRDITRAIGNDGATLLPPASPANGLLRLFPGQVGRPPTPILKVQPLPAGCTVGWATARQGPRSSSACS